MTPPLGPRRLTLLVTSVALLVTLISALRLGQLARRGWEPSARGESRWYAWAYRDPEQRARLQALEGLVEPGSRVFLTVSDPETPGAWWQVQGQYYLPGVVVEGAGPAAETPPGEMRPGEMEPGEIEAKAHRVALPEGRREGSEGPESRHPIPRLFLGSLLALGVGGLLLRFGSCRAPGPLTARLSLAWSLGLFLLAPSWLLLVQMGVLAGVWSVLGLGLATASVLILAARWARARRTSHGQSEPSAIAESGPTAPRWRSLLLLGLPLAAFAARVTAAPLWSWDHFAIWGVKARWIASGLGLGFLRDPGLQTSNPHYPLGVPAAWLVACLGGVPGEVAFKGLHVLSGVALALLVREGARRLSGSMWVADTLAALTAASPLFWDTESLGLAEMLLALATMAVVVLVLRARQGSAWDLALAGLGLGSLPWIKEEGWTLAALLGVWALWQAPRGWSGPEGRRHLAALALPAAVLAAVQLWMAEAVLGEGLSFLAGDAGGRVAARLGDLTKILGEMMADLARPDWLGFWLLVAAAALSALAARHRHALALLAIPAVQLAVYASIYLATYLDPLQHIHSSFFRIAAALVPLASLALARLVGYHPGLDDQATPRTG